MSKQVKHLREVLQLQLNALRSELSADRRFNQERFATTEKADARLDANNDKHFEVLNGHAAMLKEQSATFVTKEQMDNKLQLLHQRLESAEKLQTSSTAHSAGAEWLWVKIGGLILIALEIYATFTR